MNQTNKDFCVEYVEPTHYKTLYSDEPYSIVTSSLVRDMDKPFEIFIIELEKEIMSWPKDTLLGIFPEYCWRKTSPVEIFNYIKILQTKIPKILTLVLGTLEFTLNGKYTNNAIIIYEDKIWYVPKTKVLHQDKLNGLVSGYNNGVISLPRFRLAVLVCADLWDTPLCYKLALIENADILAVPAWTSTFKGNRIQAKQDWHSLARTRSTEYSVIVAVADHIHNFPNHDVANATYIFTPANRGEIFSDENVNKSISIINPTALKLHVDRWKQKGLGQSLVKLMYPQRSSETEHHN